MYNSLFMKKHLIFLLFISCLGLLAFGYETGFYSLSCTGINNEAIPFDQYRGKKVLVIVLPLTAEDSLSVTPQQLFNLASKHKDSLVIIGVPGEETGYTDLKKDQVKNLYTNLPANFILTAGMQVAKSSGEQQAELFKWLTDVKKNKYFDKEVKGTGHKFFVNGHGQLYAVFGPRLKLSHPIIETVLSRPGSGSNH
jgi:glutathione peroxidase